jgi:Ca2+-transporting ATPase
VLILQQGDEIPADGYLLDSCDMLVNESMFSGNARCVKSTDHADFDFSAQFATDHLVGGSWVLEGEGIMEVTAVGERTALASMLRKRVDDSESVLRLKLLFI